MASRQRAGSQHGTSGTSGRAMINAIGYDAMHVNVSVIPVNAEVVLGYDTGTLNIRWTPQDFARFTTRRKVHIDQGGPGSPVFTSHVRDVETGAWTPESAINGGIQWNAPRPTIYCNRDTLPRVTAAGWRGDLWLAIPMNTPPSHPPIVPGCTVVAVQYGFPVARDLSVVFDPYWPMKGPIVTGTQFPAPANLRETVDVSLAWDAIPVIPGHPDTGYTVSVLQLDGVEAFHTVVDVTHVMVTGLHPAWTYNVHVWANGGDVAPPHASLTVNT